MTTRKPKSPPPKPHRRASEDQRTAAPVPLGDLIASVLPESAAVVRPSKGGPEAPLPDLYDTLNTLTVKVGTLTDTIGLFQQCLEAFDGQIETLREAQRLIDKRIDKIQKKVDRRPGEHNRIKVLAGHLRTGDRYGGKTVTWLGKTWDEKFLQADDEVPLGVVFASGETFRWANVQYAYLEADPDDDSD